MTDHEAYTRLCALAGIPDPARAIAAARTELEFCALTFESMGGSGPAHAKRVRAALALLTPAGEQP